MANQPGVFQKQFENSFKSLKIMLLLCGIKLSEKPWNRFIEHFFKRQLFYYGCIILYTVIVGEIYGVIDCIQSDKSIVETSFNFPCITISLLATVKGLFLYLNRDLLVDLIHKLNVIHSENDKEGVAAIEYVKEGQKLLTDSIKILNAVILMMTGMYVVVQLMFYLVPGLVMAYGYFTTQKLVVAYPYFVKYTFFEVTESSWWPLIYLHQSLATIFTCSNCFGCDILFCVLAFYIDIHFRMLSLQFESTVSLSNDETMNNLSVAIKRHQELIDLVNQMEQIYSKSTLFHMLTASLMICLSAFIITIADEMNVIIPFSSFLVMSLTQVALSCYFADMIMRSSTQLCQSIYTSPWYEANEDAKKIILIIMIRSQKECKLTAWGFIDLNLMAFSRILSTSWSYFALLRTMYD